MLAPYYRSLLFPQLVKIDDVEFSSWSNGNTTNSPTTPLYKLDWDYVDSKKEETFYTHIKNGGMKNGGYVKNPESEVWYGTMPEPYNSRLKGLEFAIPAHYMAQIRFSILMSNMVRGQELSFDTNIREECLYPSQAHIYVAFRMIQDCMFDREKNYFYRGEDKFFIINAMLYKFWVDQTGCGTLKKLSRFHQIDNSFTFAQKKEVKAFIATINEFERTAFNSCQGTPETGPSLGEPDETKPLKFTKAPSPLYHNKPSTTLTIEDDKVVITKSDTSSNDGEVKITTPKLLTLLETFFSPAKKGRLKLDPIKLDIPRIGEVPLVDVEIRQETAELPDFFRNYELVGKIPVDKLGMDPEKFRMSPAKFQCHALKDGIKLTMIGVRLIRYTTELPDKDSMRSVYVRFTVDKIETKAVGTKNKDSSGGVKIVKTLNNPSSNRTVLSLPGQRNSYNPNGLQEGQVVGKIGNVCVIPGGMKSEDYPDGMKDFLDRSIYMEDAPKISDVNDLGIDIE